MLVNLILTKFSLNPSNSKISFRPLSTMVVDVVAAGTTVVINPNVSCVVRSDTLFIIITIGLTLILWVLLILILAPTMVES